MTTTAPKRKIRQVLIGLILVMEITILVIPSYAQVTANVLRRTRPIKIDSTKLGTAFTIEVDRRQYLITAKHIVQSLPDGQENTIQILEIKGWTSIKVRVFKCDDPCDIAVLVPPAQLTVAFPLQPSSVRMILGQDVHFVGYPFGMIKTYAGSPDVFGVVKKATVAQFDSMPDKDMSLILLDGYNNPGFSGSPVVYQNFFERDSSGQPVLKVAGVISGFRHDWSEIKEKEKEIQQSEITPADLTDNNVFQAPDGKFYRLKSTDKVVALNTGIIRAWDIGSAVTLIQKHPIGPMVNDSFTGIDAN